jgi:MFS transporter, SP family, arabinose:H+ symporter
MKSRIIFWSVTSAMAGLLFGFDTVVISGAEGPIQKLWTLNSFAHGLLVGAGPWGMLLGSLIGGWPTDRFGRKITLTCIGVLFLASAVGCAFAWDPYSFLTARLIGGIGIGISTVVAPLYISEISPPAVRGRLAGMFQFNIVFGILLAYFSNYMLGGIGANAWRWMLGVAAFPSIVYTGMCLFLPESPRWLLTRKRDRQAGIQVLQLIEPEASIAQLESEADQIVAASEQKVEAGRFWTRRLRFPIALAMLIAFFNQLSGINAVLYFAPRIFKESALAQEKEAGPAAEKNAIAAEKKEVAAVEKKKEAALTDEEKAADVQRAEKEEAEAERVALLNSVKLGVTNFIFTFVGLWLIDRMGRRTLLYIGSFGYIVSLGLTSWAFFTGHSAFVPYFLCAFIAAHAVGQGAVIWVFLSEIFPNRHRAQGQSLGSSTHWLFCALLATFFPMMVPEGSGSTQVAYVFAFFCAMMVLQLVWVKLMVPETKGVPLEELERRLTGSDAA